MDKPGVVFLMYHELSVPGRKPCHSEPGYTRYVVQATNFRAQMERLAAESWHGKSVGQALGAFDAHSVAVTFDDGSETDLISAVPVLKELGFGATFYITAGFVGKRGYLSRAQVQELSGMGFDVGCHSMTHPYLTDVAATQLGDETAGAKEFLEQMSGSPVVHFSCPGGRWNATVVEAVRQAGFQSMATSSSGVNFAGADPFTLSRVPVLANTSLEQFKRLCRGRGLRWMRLKEKARDATKQALGNSAYDSLRSLILAREKSSRKI